MKPSSISVAMLVVSLLFAPALLSQSPDSANQNVASPAPSPATAEVPRLIKFGGTLLDVQDRPMRGPVGVTFALYSQQTGGAALWLETQNVKPDASGVYSILLGANSANGVPAELFASGEARWLEVQVERQAEQPRVLLVSVPYALKAKDAETLGGKPASAFVTNETLAGAGNSAAVSPAVPSSSTASTALPNSTAQTTLKKAASTPPPAAACTNVTSDGTAAVNSIAAFTTACNIESSVISQVGSNVGIGTAAPGVALDVLGNNAGLRLSGTGTHQVTVTGATSGRLGQDSSGFFFASDTNGKTVRFLTNNGTLNEWMRITSAGTVGIGTTTPSAVLHVLGSQPAASTGSGAVATQVLQLTGGKGGNTTASGFVAGAGAAVNITAGAGGDAPAGSTNGTGGSVTIQGGAAGAGGGAAGSYGNVMLAPLGGHVVQPWAPPLTIIMDDGPGSSTAIMPMTITSLFADLTSQSHSRGRLVVRWQNFIQSPSCTTSGVIQLVMGTTVLATVGPRTCGGRAWLDVSSEFVLPAGVNGYDIQVSTGGPAGTMAWRAIELVLYE